MDFNVVPAGEARLSVFDRGFLFGDSVYEVVRVYGNRPLALDRHFIRLNRSSHALGFELPFGYDTLKKHFLELVEKLNRKDAYIRIVVTRGAGDVALCPPEGVKPVTVMLAAELPPWPNECYEKGVSLITVNVRRNLRGALNPMIKSGNYLNNMLAVMEARMKGGSDCVMLNAGGRVTESSTANIFIVDERVLVTPPVEAGLLDGITRGIVLELAEREGIPFEERLFGVDDLRAADECFLSSTTREVMPVCRLDDQVLEAPGPLTRKVMDLYRRVTSSS
jgi:branched-chain amino acid aminotransferase